jgi:23S rRNA (uridine2552-2'-O)-methyltransferase
MDRAISALHGCAARLARRPVRAVRAIATEACRRAVNGAEFLARAQRETGLQIDVISSREEVELALESCAPLLRDGGRRALLFDIGGGSTELAWVRLPEQGEPPQLIGYLSMPVGVVTLAERFGAQCQTAAGFDAMVDDVAERLYAFESVHRIGQELRQGGVRLLGTSGTVTTLAGIVLQLPRYSRPAVDGAVLSGGDAEAALARLRTLGRDGLARHPCIGADRAEFAAGLRHLRRHPSPLAGARNRGGRPRAARGHAAADDPGRTLARAAAGARMSNPTAPRGLSVKLRTARGRSGASQRWLTRQLNDPYVAAAKAQGWRSRAAFKLIELDERFSLLHRGQRVIDLGAAPGGWSQVAVRGGAVVFGLDLLAIDAMPGATFLQGDFADPEMPGRLEALIGGKVDLVLSDMSPNTTGHGATDHIRIAALAEQALEFATGVLRPDGAFVAKMFQGGSERQLLTALKKRFAAVRHAKPPASRKGSSELYVVATGFRGA